MYMAPRNPNKKRKGIDSSQREYLRISCNFRSRSRFVSNTIAKNDCQERAFLKGIRYSEWLIGNDITQRDQRITPPLTLIHKKHTEL